MCFAYQLRDFMFWGEVLKYLVFECHDVCNLRPDGY